MDKIEQVLKIDAELKQENQELKRQHDTVMTDNQQLKEQMAKMEADLKNEKLHAIKVQEEMQ